MPTSDHHPALKRQIGVVQGSLLGLGSILGTGVYFGILDVVTLSGSATIIAVVAAGLLAACNAMSSAQLAAAHPVSGGTYEYGYRWLTPRLGFTAGWMFLCAKSASAATAALATAYYLLEFCKLDSTVAPPLALLIVMLMTVLVVGGLKRSAWTNCLLVVITLAGLCAFAGSVAQSDDAVLPDWMYLLPDSQGVPSLLKATALMFVAYTGYGRVATLGEEIHNPRTSIPKAIITTLLASLLLYVLVALAVTAIADRIHNDQPEARSLAGLAAGRASPVTVVVITTGAVTAMLGVLLNLLLGLSRVVLAMARREDMPGMFSKLNSNQTTPFAAVILVGAIVAGLLLLKDARATWSLSAFTVLLYYSLTNLAALRLEQCDRLYPRWISVLGLVGCLMLAFFVDLRSIVMGAAILLAGLLWQTLTSPQVRRPLSDGKAD